MTIVAGREMLVSAGSMWTMAYKRSGPHYRKDRDSAFCICIRSQHCLVWSNSFPAISRGSQFKANCMVKGKSRGVEPLEGKKYCKHLTVGSTDGLRKPRHELIVEHPVTKHNPGRLLPYLWRTRKKTWTILRCGTGDHWLIRILPIASPGTR